LPVVSNEWSVWSWVFIQKSKRQRKQRKPPKNAIQHQAGKDWNCHSQRKDIYDASTRGSVWSSRESLLYFDRRLLLFEFSFGKLSISLIKGFDRLVWSRWNLSSLKSLSKDKTVKEKNGTNSTFVPGVNVYYSKKK
jgi:hypothetical protein